MSLNRIIVKKMLCNQEVSRRLMLINVTSLDNSCSRALKKKKAKCATIHVRNYCLLCHTVMNQKLQGNIA